MDQEILAILRSGLITIAALVPIVNPLGAAPMFLSMSADLPSAARRRLAGMVGRHAFVLLAAAMLVGSYVLQFFGISMPTVRVAGGLLVTANGWRLLNAEDTHEIPAPPVAETWERELARRAFFPLTFPLTVGPGSISIAITLGARVPPRGTSAMMQVTTDMVAVGVVALLVYLSYRFASRLIATLGDTGTAVFLRLSAFILMCVGVNITWSGLVELIEPLLQR